MVEPLLERAFPGIPFSAARLESGSDVLGLDDAMSQEPDLRRLPLVGIPEFWTDEVRVLTDHALRRRMVAALLGP